MKELFKGFYQPDHHDYKELWENGIFVFDANVLLNLYRFPDNVRNEVIKVIKALEDRIWIPFHVALEYQRNRASEISAQKSRYYDVNKIVDSVYSSTKSDLDKLQLRKRHSKINPDKFLTQIHDAVSEFKEELKQLESEQPSTSEIDAIRNVIDEIFIGKVGPPPNDQKQLDELSKEGVERYKAKIPPGFKDVTKGNELFSYGGLVYEHKLGDLIVWKQIIAYSKENNIKSLVFITDDTKEDWWWIEKEGPKKTLGPRPELIEEINREAGTINFYIYNSERFLKYSSEYLNTKVSDESISQVRDITEIEDERKRYREENIKQWRILIESLFKGNVPSSYSWNGIDEIVEILNVIGSHGQISHVFLPNGGGLDISGAKISVEKGCIEMEFGGSSHIVRPRELRIETFDGNFTWAYFRLDTYELSPSGIYKDLSDDYESLTQLEPGRYESWGVWDRNYLEYDIDGNEVPLPDSARPATRHFKGSFVIFAKGSIYNQISDTYDARHNKMDAATFRDYIYRGIKSLEKSYRDRDAHH